MNDGPSTFTAAEASSRLDADIPQDDPMQQQEEEEDGRAAMDKATQHERRKMAHNRRIDCLDEVLVGLDTLIYAELATIYYLDNSFTYLLLRVLIHFFHLTPKPTQLSSLAPPTPHIASLLGTNALCALIHFFLFHPFASVLRSSPASSARGYIHGSLAIDFVGQRPPRSRFQLIGLDVLVTALQMVMMATTLRRRAMRKRRLTPFSLSGDDVTNTRTAVSDAPGASNTVNNVNNDDGEGARDTSDGGLEPYSSSDSELSDWHSSQSRQRRQRRRRRRRRRRRGRGDIADLDAEERGSLRRASTLSSMASDDAAAATATTIALADEEEGQQEGFYARRTAGDALDLVESGQAIVLKLDVLRVMGVQLREMRERRRRRRVVGV